MKTLISNIKKVCKKIIIGICIVSVAYTAVSIMLPADEDPIVQKPLVSDGLALVDVIYVKTRDGQVEPEAAALLLNAEGETIVLVKDESAINRLQPSKRLAVTVLNAQEEIKTYGMLASMQRFRNKKTGEVRRFASDSYPSGRDWSPIAEVK